MPKNSAIGKTPTATIIPAQAQNIPNAQLVIFIK
jgi:hypothetical protein